MGREKDLALYQMVERIAPKMVSEKKRSSFTTCINVDFYSGLLYSMLGIPEEMYTPIFAVARV